MKKLLPAFGTALLLLACGTPNAPAEEIPAKLVDGTTARYSELVLKLMGAWTDSVSEPGAVVHELWTENEHDFHSGTGFVMVGKDTVFIEHIQLALPSTGRAGYRVRVPSQNEGEEVFFALAACIGDSMVFENPAHDFPQRIVYALQTNGDWIARVSGQGKDGAPRGFSYRFKRVGYDEPN